MFRTKFISGRLLTKRFFNGIILTLLISCSGGEKGKIKQSDKEVLTEKLTEFEVNEEIHNFGKLKAGENVIFSFVLKNTGNADLIVKNVEGDCGCISTHFNNKPVAPGEKTVVEVDFDTAGLFGKQFKSIALKVNTKEKIKYLAVAADVENDQIEINN